MRITETLSWCDDPQRIKKNGCFEIKYDSYQIFCECVLNGSITVTQVKMCVFVCEYHMVGNVVLGCLWLLTGGWSLMILVTEAWPTDGRPHTLHRTCTDLSHVRLLASPTYTITCTNTQMH